MRRLAHPNLHVAFRPGLIAYGLLPRRDPVEVEAARTYRRVVLFDKVLPRVVGSVTIDAAVLVL